MKQKTRKRRIVMARIGDFTKTKKLEQTLTLSRMEQVIDTSIISAALTDSRDAERGNTLEIFKLIT